MNKKFHLSYNAFYSFYTLLAFLSFFVVLIFGIRPAYISMGEKSVQIKKLEEEGARLDTTISALTQQSTTLEEAMPYLEALTIAIPSGTASDIALIELLGISAKNGYLLKNVLFGERSLNEDGGSSINLSLEGDFYNIGSFTQSIEESAMSMEVEGLSASFSAKPGGNDTAITVQIKLFNFDPIK